MDPLGYRQGSGEQRPKCYHTSTAAAQDDVPLIRAPRHYKCVMGSAAQAQAQPSKRPTSTSKGSTTGEAPTTAALLPGLLPCALRWHGGLAPAVEGEPPQFQPLEHRIRAYGQKEVNSVRFDQQWATNTGSVRRLTAFPTGRHHLSS